MVRTLADLYKILEQATLEEVIMYYILIYFFTAIIRMIISTEFEVNNKLKLSPKIVLGLILLYTVGGINWKLNSYYPQESYLALLALSLTILSIGLILVRILVYYSIAPAIFAISFYITNWRDLRTKKSEDKELKFKHRYKHNGLLDQASSQSKRFRTHITTPIINLVAGSVLSIYFFKVGVLVGVCVLISAYSVIIRDGIVFYRTILKSVNSSFKGKFVESFVEVNLRNK